MNVLSVTPYYDPEGGGLERYAHEVLRRIAADGHDVVALASTRKGLRDEERDGVKIRRRTPAFVLGNSPVDPSLVRVCRQAIRSFVPDVVVAHTPVPFPAEMAYRAARGARVPFVLTYHAGRLRGSNTLLNGLASVDRHTLERSMLAGCDGLIAVSPFVRDRALRHHRERVTVVPPGVDAGRFTPSKRAGPSRRVLFVGPLSHGYRWKGVDVLWRAFRRVRRRFPDAALVLVGTGKRREGFIRRARREGIPLRCPGRLTPEALVSEYRQAALTVLPSTSEAESFGMVLAEANACGRPVVASRIGGIPGFVRHGENGLLARPGDERDLADRINELLADPERARVMGLAGRRLVREHHDWDRLARRTLTVLERVDRRR